MSGTTTSEAQIGWQDYLAVVIRRRWFFVIPCVVITLVTMAVGFTLPKLYRSQTVLLVEDPKIMNPLMKGVAVSTPVDRRMQVVQQELLSWNSLSRLSRELGLDRSARTPLALEGVVKRLRKNITVLASRNGLITLTYVNSNPELAQRVLNTVTNIYVQRNVEAQTTEAQTAIKFIDNEMTVYKQKLEEAENALREFKELHAMEMPVAASLNRQIIQLQVGLAQLLVENTEDHPTVVQVKRQIQELTAKRNEEVKRVIAHAMLRGASPEFYGDLLQRMDAPAGAQSGAPADPKVEDAREAYQAWVQRLDHAALSGQQSASAPGASSSAPAEDGTSDSDLSLNSEPLSMSLGPREEQEMARLRRDYKVHASAYQEMKQRLERANMTQRLGESDEGTKFKVIEPARLPLRPFSPNLWLMFVGSLAGGLFIGICAAFTAEYLDQSFQSQEDLHSVLALPVLGAISTIVTPGDVAARRKSVKTWMSGRPGFERLNTYVWKPVWSRVDRWLLRLGL